MEAEVELSCGKFRTGNIKFLNQYINGLIVSNKKDFIPNHNVNSLRLIKRSQKLRKIFDNSTYIAIDGMPVIWMAKACGANINSEYRATFLDWMPELWTLANENHWKVFLLGTNEKTIRKTTEILAKQYPNIKFEYHNGYFAKEGRESEIVKNRINQFEPNILLVGFGMPLQEFWIDDNISSLSINVALSCGGYFDYIADERLIPPRWIGKIGFEWLYRFAMQPKRLFKRYFIEPWPVLIDFMIFYLKGKR